MPATMFGPMPMCTVVVCVLSAVRLCACNMWLVFVVLVFVFVIDSMFMKRELHVVRIIGLSRYIVV